MDNSTIISVASLVIALLALPMSYFVAIRQVKVGLAEHERRTKKRARILVANSIGEFFKIFYTAVKQFAHIEQSELQARLKEIDPHLKEIDDFVEKTQVLGRLASAIDGLFAVDAISELPCSEDLVKRLQSIRNQIALGSDPTRYVTLGVISACGGVDIESSLKQM